MLSKLAAFMHLVWATLAPSLFGSGIALIFMEPKSWRVALPAFFAGSVTGYYVARGLQELLGWGPFWTSFVQFGTGLFTMALLPVLFAFIREDLRAILREWIGSGGGLKALGGLLMQALKNRSTKP
jgi:hypothetical protein